MKLLGNKPDVFVIMNIWFINVLHHGNLLSLSNLARSQLQIYQHGWLLAASSHQKKWVMDNTQVAHIAVV